MEFWNRAQEAGRKSFRYEELEPDFFFHSHGGLLVPYLDISDKYAAKLHIFFRFQAVSVQFVCINGIKMINLRPET